MSAVRCAGFVCGILIALGLIRGASTETKIVCVSKEKFSSCADTFTDVDSALTFLGNTTDSATVVISPGSYNLSSNIHFVFISSFTITSASSERAEIQCGADAGIGFENSSYISFESIDFVGCGARHSIGLKKVIYATLYFQLCSYISLSHVYVLNGNGVGLVFYGCNGINNISASAFNNCHPPSDPGMTSMSEYFGGGIHISYPYRFYKQSPNNCSPFLSSEHASVALYNISHCNFTGNSAGNSSDLFYDFSLPEKMDYYFDGCGGGLLVFFMGDSANKSVLVDHCIFEGNEGTYGGGACATFEDGSRNNTIRFSNTHFVDNNVSADGGGVYAEFYAIDNTEGNGNTISFDNCWFQNNNATVGGGLVLHGAKRYTNGQSRDSLVFSNCTWKNNTASLGTALGFSLWHPLDMGSEPLINFTDCQFLRNDVDRYYINGKNAGMATVFVHSISLHFLNRVLFANNIGTGIYAVNSKIEFHSGCSSIFEYNYGINGGAFCLIAASYILVGPNTTFNFIGNRASQYGNVLYGLLPSDHDAITPRSSLGNCYIHYHDPTMAPYNWTANFYFENNTDPQRKDAIAVTSLMPCIYGNESDVTSLLNDVFCWNQTWHYSDGNCKDQVISLISRFEMGGGDTFSVRAGEVKFMDIIAYDDQNENLTKSLVLTADVASNQGIQVVDTYRYISDNKIKFKQDDRKENKATVRIRTLFPRILQAKVEVSIEPCPPAYELSDDTGFCECKDYHHIVMCEGNLTAKIRRHHWVGNYNITLNNTKSIAGYCAYCVNEHDYVTGDYVAIPISDDAPSQYQCPNGSFGPLCSVCEAGYGMSVHQFHCVECAKTPAGFILVVYLLLMFVPSTILFFTLFFTNFSLASPHLNAAIFFGQIIRYTLDVTQGGTIPINSLFKSSTASILLDIQEVLYGVWNLSFCSPCLPSFCLSSGINHANPVWALKYVERFFPLLFVVGIFTYRYLANMNSTCMIKLKQLVLVFRPLKVCSECFGKHFNFSTARSLRNVIASCVILAYTGCTVITYRILSFSFLRNRAGAIEVLLPTYDQSTRYLEGSHVYYFVLAVTVTVVFLIPVPLILIFLRFNEKAVTGRVNESYLNILLEVFQRPFKSDSRVQYSNAVNDENSLTVTLRRNKQSFWRRHNCGNFYDCRWVAGAYFVLRASMILSSMLSSMLCLLAQQVICLVMVLIILIVQPYKEDWNNKLDGFILSLIITINGITMYQYYLTVIGMELSEAGFIIQYFLSYIPFFWIAGYIINQIYCFFKRARTRSATGSNSFFSSTQMVTEAADNISKSDADTEEHLKYLHKQHDKAISDLPSIYKLLSSESLSAEEVPLLEGDGED